MFRLHMRLSARKSISRQASAANIGERHLEASSRRRRELSAYMQTSWKSVLHGLLSKTLCLSGKREGGM